MTDLEIIMAMCGFKRPHGSFSEMEFIERFILPLGASFDRNGNAVVIVGEKKPDILWSCHTDTVHAGAGYQRLHFDGRWLSLHKKASSSCLGADCAAGVFIMTQMIKARIPGLYVFHANEEKGCHGSQAFAKDNAEYLASFRAAIAFDRKGDSSIITHMTCRTCSAAFASSVAAQLPGYKADDTGANTDTKHYRGIIPECTNLSVGYTGQHTSAEKLDVPFLLELRDLMINKFDPSKLVIERDPKAADEYKSYANTSYYNYAPTTMYGLLFNKTEAAAKVLLEMMSFEEMKALVLQKEKELEEERKSYRGGTKQPPATSTVTPPSNYLDKTKPHHLPVPTTQPNLNAAKVGPETISSHAGDNVLPFADKKLATHH